MKKFLALLLALVLTLSAVPFAAATEADDSLEPPASCLHETTETTYEPNNDGTHMVTVTCTADCGEVVDEQEENCADADGDTDCDKCYADVEVEGACPHAETTETEVPNNDGTHTLKTVCNADDCGVTVTETVSDCADADEDGLCDVCEAEMAEEEEEQQKAFITCPQNGSETFSSSKTMDFTLGGVETDDVTWSFSVSGSAEADLTAMEYNGKSASATVAAKTTGLAKVTATAKWEDGEVSATFNVSFYVRKDWVVYVKEGETSIRFTDTDVFSKVSGVYADKVDNYSLYRLLTDGRATRVILSEESRNNEDVGLISYKTTGKFYQYDPDEYNDYAIKDMGNLIFTAVGEGTYKLKYELYEMSGNKGLATTRGTLSIVVGDPGENSADIVYRTTGESIVFDEDDFIDYWEDRAHDYTEKLEYVKFDVDELEFGLLYLDKTERGTVKSSYKFCPDYTKAETGMYDLNAVTYRPDPRETRYTEEIDFVAYGNRNGVVRGTVTIILGEEVPFADVKEADWFYDEVAYVFANNIMNGVSDKEFDPNGTLTRAMVVTMLYRVADEPNAYDNGTFSDVASDAWYADAVEWAAHNEIVEGMGNGKFAPDAAITREQLAAILYRFAKYDRKDTSLGDSGLEDFKDDNKVSSWAEDAMTWAVRNKIMEGSNSYLNPKNTATRAEAAAMFRRFLSN